MLRKRAYWIAEDQYGTLHNLGYTRAPRKRLLETLGRQHADKMYLDRPGGGDPIHTGYVVAGLWCRLLVAQPLGSAELELASKRASQGA